MENKEIEVNSKPKRKYVKKVVKEVKEDTEKKKVLKKNKIYSNWELFGTEGLDKSGWAGLLNPFLEKLFKYNNDKDYPERTKLVPSQVKEKYGELCIYGGFPKELDEHRNMAEEMSDHICMYCGSPAHVGQTTGGYIETVCKKCAEKLTLYPLETFWEEQYHSVKMDNIIRIALVIQRGFDGFKKFLDILWYKRYVLSGKIRFWFFHFVLRNKKYDNTIHDYTFDYTSFRNKY